MKVTGRIFPLPWTVMDNIDQLPDYPRLEQLAAALWRRPGGGPGAALMVGAGFSRNCKCVTPESPLPPLWSELRDRMADRLAQPGVGSDTADPLRMAEEFRAYFGQSALEDFIRTNVPDAKWMPGDAHRNLVELPWSDILTTNWDTLLERAARTCRQHNYDPVLRGADLAHTRSPRIVKLHGTVGDGGGYVFAEEDYRTYATRHAALVNAARQVFIENEVCLLGFSGDDPNFLQWSGWVRDQLGSATRRIYLVGVLALSRAARQLLESRNIAPIDLAELVSDVPLSERPGRAATLFIAFLQSAQKPPLHEWEPISVTPIDVDEHHMVAGDSVIKRARLDALATRLVAERESYPGWMVLPVALLRQLEWQTSSIENIIRAGDSEPEWGDPDQLLRVKIELAWRYTLSLSTLSKVARRVLETAWDLAQQGPVGPLANRIIAPLLLRDARERGQGPAFRLWASRLKSEDDPDVFAITAYERAIQARDQEDWQGLEQLQSGVSGPDPAWQLRRARLLFDLYRSEDAVALLETTLEGIREQMAFARDSIWLRSRRAWCQWLLYYARRQEKDSPHRSGMKDLQQETRYLCNPADDVREIGRLVADAALGSASAGGVLPGFRPGTYQTVDPDRPDFVMASSPGARYARFRNAAALPLWIGQIGMVLEHDMRARLMLPPATLALASLWPYVSRTDVPREMERVLARVAIAQLRVRQAQFLKRRLWNTLQYWLKRMDPAEPAWKQHVAPVWGAIVVLGRLTPRLPERDLSDLWRLSIQLAGTRSLAQWRTDPRITELATLAADGLTKTTKATLAFDVVSRPYPGETEPVHPAREHEPTFYSVLRSAPAAVDRGPHAEAWALRISQLIQGLQLREGREGAIRLLFELHLDGALSEDEITRFSEALWLERGPSGLPARSNVVPSLLAKLPAPRDVNLDELLKGVLFPGPAVPLKRHEYIRALQFAGEQALNVGLSRESARKILFSLNEAAARYDGGDPMMLETNVRDVRSAVGLALGRIVLPSLTRPRGTDIDEAIRSVQNLRMPGALEGLSQMVRSPKSLYREHVVQLIQAHLMSTDWRSVASACKAMEWWLPTSPRIRATRLQSYPHQLTATLLAAIDALHDGSVHSILSTMRKVLDSKLLTSGSEKRLIAALPTVLELYDYNNLDPDSPRVIEVSLVRRECGLLIRELLPRDSSGLLSPHWVKLLNDPLPEVRRAFVDN